MNDHEMMGTQGEGPAGSEQYLTFLLAGEEYGVDILQVQEIKGWDNATHIPNTPPYVRGVINLRGTIVPVIDLRQRFGLEQMDYTRTTVVIVLKIEDAGRDRVSGIVVDAVSDVYNVSEDQRQPAPEFAGQVGGDFVKGLATVGDKIVILLETAELIRGAVGADSHGSLDLASATSAEAI